MTTGEKIGWIAVLVAAIFAFKGIQSLFLYSTYSVITKKFMLTDRLINR
jgi:hypothetical protein